MGKDKLILGKTKEGRSIHLDEGMRKLHMHIIGASGRGKSRFIEHLITHDILNGHGLCLIDPHGQLYNDILKWAENKGLQRRGTLGKKIILFDPSSADWSFGFNFLPGRGRNLEAEIKELGEVFARVWGEDHSKTPRLKKWLSSILSTLADRELPFLMAEDLVSETDKDFRNFLTEGVELSVVARDWIRASQMSTKEFRENLDSTDSRLRDFLFTRVVRNIFGQRGRVLDFHKIMDEGYVLLVNLGSAGNKRGNVITNDDKKVLGSLFVHSFLRRAMERPEGSKSFYLYIDECANYLNENIEEILTGCRKFGLHLILAHQDLGQLKDAGEKVYKGVMGGAQTKVVFGGLPMDEAEIMAKEIYAGWINLEEEKLSMRKPVVVAYETKLFESYSQSKGRSSSTSESSGHSEAIADGSGAVQGDSVSRTLMTPDGLPIMTHANSNSLSSSASRTRGNSHSSSTTSSESESESWGQSEGLVPIMEERPGQLFSLPEQIYKKAADLKNQIIQHMVVAVPGYRTVEVKAPHVGDVYVRESRIEGFKERCYNLVDYAQPVEDVERQIKETREGFILEFKKKTSEHLEFLEREDFKVDDFEEAVEDKRAKVKQKGKAKKEKVVEWPDEFKNLR